jgi:oligoribonuclease (3'-5' exoribonuclease)/DNA-directed RNA polymerase subunit RPC12/RpoP
MTELLKTTKMVRCPKCGIEGESNLEDTELTCPHCGNHWTHLTIPRNTEHFDHYLFLDYETTGEPDHKLLEVGWMVTDRNLIQLFECQSTVIAQSRLNLSAEVLKMHTRNGLLDEVARTTSEVWDAEKLICDSIRPLTEDKSVRLILAGFTCHFDRNLMHRDMTHLDSWLHYRHFDVSVLRGCYNNWVEKIVSRKGEHPHRVKDDCISAWLIAKTYMKLFQEHFPKGLSAQGVAI